MKCLGIGVSYATARAYRDAGEGTATKPDVRRNLIIVLALVGLLLLIKGVDLAVAPNHVYPGRLASFGSPELAAGVVAGLLRAWLAAHTEVVRLGVVGRPRATLLSARLTAAALGAAVALLDALLRMGDINVGLPPLWWDW